MVVPGGRVKLSGSEEIQGVRSEAREKVGNKNVQHLENNMGCKSGTRMSIGSVDMASGKPKCEEGYCANSAVIALEARDLCLDHFLSCCYERLDRLEPMVRRRSLEVAEILSAGAFLKECSDLVLLVCLRFEKLSNLERSRLLNILLLSGDLQLRLSKPLVKTVGHASDV